MFNMLRGGAGSVVVRALAGTCVLSVGCGVSLSDDPHEDNAHPTGRPTWQLPAIDDGPVAACLADPSGCQGVNATMVAAAVFTSDGDLPRLHLHDARFDTTTGAVLDGPARVTIPSFLLPRAANGTAIRAFILDELTIDNASAFASNTDHGPALAIITRGKLTVVGTLSISSTAGSMSSAQCTATDGTVLDRTDSSGLHASYAAGGGGGGGFGTAGGVGGDVVSSTGTTAGGGSGGLANGAQGLVPLRGGCPGGSSDDTGGGGAVELASQRAIEIDGTIDVRGRDGAIHNAGPRGGTIAGGGGSGGGILLEAPQVILAPDAVLLAGGGTGGGASTTWCDALVCGVGGDGATLGMAARAGTDMADAPTDVAGGGGGGGLGQIRINTATDVRGWSQTAVVQGEMTSGVIGSR